MRPVQIHGTVKKIQQLVRFSKQALREGAYRVANRLHAVVLNMEGKTAPEIADVLKVHRSNVCLWLQRWQQDGVDRDEDRRRTFSFRFLYRSAALPAQPEGYLPAFYLCDRTGQLASSSTSSPSPFEGLPSIRGVQGKPSWIATI